MGRRSAAAATLSIAFIAVLVVYLINIEIPVGALKELEYDAIISKKAVISIYRIYYNEAYPLMEGQNLTIYITVGGVRANITVPYKPGEELKPGASAGIDLEGVGPWPVYVFDDSLGREILVGVVDRTSDLIVQTGLYSALLSVTIISKLHIEVRPPSDIGVIAKLKYANRSVEALDLGTCRAQGALGCSYNIERQDLAGYDISFYSGISILRARVSDGLLIVSPYDNPHVFIPALVLTFTLALALALHGGGERTKRVKRRRR